jgi:glycosyltransferase involved in cell wall biosynthesis
MRRILLISYSYTPGTNPRAFRWTTVAEYWARQGHQVSVISSWMPELPRYEMLNGVHIYRVGGAITEALRSRVRQSDKIPKTMRDQFTPKTPRSQLASLVKLIHDHTWKQVYWPDYACFWYFPALKKAKQLLESFDYTAVISVSHPFTGHLVGLSLKKQYYKMQWVVDIGDPFCFLERWHANNQKLYNKLNYTCERKVFRQANSITVTTEKTFKKYGNLFPESATKIQVIPPLLALDMNHASEGSLFTTIDSKLRLVFVGTLHKQIRKPDFLLRLFNKLLHTHLAEKLELHFVGSLNNCQEYFEPYKALLNHKIFCHGILSRHQAFLAMKEADILVNIGNESPYELPSKVVEYASFGKPVLNIAKIEKDTSMEFFNAYPASLCLLENGEIWDSDHVDKLVQFIEKQPHLEQSQLQQWLAPYQIESIAADYEVLLKN